MQSKAGSHTELLISAFRVQAVLHVASVRNGGKQLNRIFDSMQSFLRAEINTIGFSLCSMPESLFGHSFFEMSCKVALFNDFFSFLDLPIGQYSVSFSPFDKRANASSLIPSESNLCRPFSLPLMKSEENGFNRVATHYGCGKCTVDFLAFYCFTKS